MDASLISLSQDTTADHVLEFRRDAIHGLLQSPKSLPCKYLYDDTGSKLFDQICRLPEYYLTTVELQIMRDHVSSICQSLGTDIALIEYGSGSSSKTRLLLEHISEGSVYVPIDISVNHLRQSATKIASDFPNIEVLPVCADFMSTVELPPSVLSLRHVVYFPGSTIGNLQIHEASELLRKTTQLIDQHGGMLIGIDLQKDIAVLESAYNDSQGVTARFSENLLHRLRRQLSANVDPKQFAHHAFYNTTQHRVEIYLRSLVEQTIEIDDHCFSFARDELTLIEYSHKYTIDSFDQMARSSGLYVKQSWTDAKNYFAMLYLEPIDA